VNVDPDESAVLEAGRAIRPFIGEVIAEPGQTAALDQALAAALALDDGQTAAAEVLKLLTASRPAAEWLVDFLELGVPPALAPAPETRGPTLPGTGDILPSRRFRCPANDYTWYRRTAGQPIPFCPTHNRRLVPDVQDTAS
jgi:hypothetical protein